MFKFTLTYFVFHFWLSKGGHKHTGVFKLKQMFVTNIPPLVLTHSSVVLTCVVTCLTQGRGEPNKAKLGKVYCSNTLTRGGTYHEIWFSPEGNPKGKNHISWYVLTRVNILTLYHYENQHISWYGSLARTIFHDMVRSSGLYFMIWLARADYIFCY